MLSRHVCAAHTTSAATVVNIVNSSVVVIVREEGVGRYYSYRHTA